MVLMAALGCAAVFAEEEGFDGSYELDAPYDEGSEIPAAFQGYVHDPMQNPNAAKDIIVNPDAVYGFSPSPDSVRLAPFLEYDLTDLAVVEELKKQRIAYHESMQELYQMRADMEAEGKSIEEIQAIVDADIEKINDEMPKYKRVKQTYLRTEEFEKTTTQKIKRRKVTK